MPIIVDESGRNCFEVPVSNEIKSDDYLNLTFALKIPLFTDLGTLQASFCLSYKSSFEQMMSEPIFYLSM
jgi:hypothetical protein